MKGNIKQNTIDDLLRDKGYLIYQNNLLQQELRQVKEDFSVQCEVLQSLVQKQSVENVKLKEKNTELQYHLSRRDPYLEQIGDTACEIFVPWLKPEALKEGHTKFIAAVQQIEVDSSNKYLPIQQ